MARERKETGREREKRKERHREKEREKEDERNKGRRGTRDREPKSLSQANITIDHRSQITE